MVQLLLPKCNSHVVPEESSVPLTQVTDVGANRRKSTVRWIVRSANVQHVCRTYSAIFDSSSLVVGLLNIFGEVQRCAISLAHSSFVPSHRLHDTSMSLLSGLCV